MKNYSKISLALFLALAMIFVTFKANAQDSKPEKTEVAKIMTSAVCDMCKSRIEKVLKKDEGVVEGNLDVKTKIATVKFNPLKTNISKLRTLISKAGYDADSIPADTRAYNKLPDCCKKDAK